MEKSFGEFIHHRNVENYRRMLRETPDATRRQTLMTLLAEEAAREKEQGWLPLRA